MCKIPSLLLAPTSGLKVMTTIALHGKWTGEEGISGSS